MRAWGAAYLVRARGGVSVGRRTLLTMRPTTDLQRRVAPFEVISDFEPSGDQPDAIAELARRIRAGVTDTVLLGATGTGKSATTAWLIEQVQRPTLVMAPNKTLAAQLANEFRELLPTRSTNAWRRSNGVNQIYWQSVNNLKHDRQRALVDRHGGHDNLP